MEKLAELTIGEIIGGGSGILVILCLCIQISPIKWNPLTVFFGWIGKMTNKELFDEVNELKDNFGEVKDDVKSIKDKVNALETKVVEVGGRVATLETKFTSLETKVDREHKENEIRDMKNNRTQFLRFSEEISRGIVHSKEHYVAMLKKIDIYENFCKENPNFPNNEAIAAINLIKEDYNERLKTNDFL